MTEGWRDKLVRRAGGGLLPAIAMVAASAAATRVAATIKDLVVARRFGTSDALDAFLIAFALPVFFAGTFRSAFYSAFVPRFLEVRARRGPDAGTALLAEAATPHLLILAGLAGSLALFASPIIAVVAHGFSDEKRALARALLVALAPFVVLDGASGIYTAALNARGRVVAAALLATIPPLVTLGTVAVLASRAGAYALVLGSLAGAVLEATAAMAAVRATGVGVLPALSRPGPEAAGVLRGFTILAGGGLLMSANAVIDQAMAATAGPGSVAAIGFGAKVPAALVGLAGLALATTTLPHYASLASERRFDEMASGLKRHATRIALVSAAGAAALALISRPLVRLLFEHGSFTAADTARVAAIQSLYALQLPGYLVGIVAARQLNALGRDRAILVVAATNFVLNAAGNWVFLHWIGVPGIALSTSLFYSIGAVVLLLTCRKALREKRRSIVDS
ncbi:MAG TPA: lipid II flippase MurJ [Candidatus Polarisedimenticolaceae bacterium]|nr:lipid II flippase MurJ [Candidatus Polarisedimenticolaceae bacterium]